MKILDKYLLKSFTATFLTVFVILFMIFILQTVWLFIGELAGKDLDLSLVARFLMYKMPSVIPLVLPLSIVLASIMTFGSFAENYEFAAMKSAGISLMRAMRSLSVFILALSVATFAFANNVIPYAEFKFINFRRNIAQVKPAMAIAEGQFNSVGSYNIKVDRKSGENGNDLHSVTIHKKAEQDFGNNAVVIRARTGKLISSENSNVLKLVLNDGNYYEDIVPKKYEDRVKKPFAKSTFRKYVINIDLSKLNKASMDDQQITNTNTMLNASELRYTIDSLTKSYDRDVNSFSENISQRAGVGISRMPAARATPGKSPPPQDLAALLAPADKAQVFTVAKNNIANTVFSIEGSQVEMENKLKDINGHYISLYDKFVFALSCFLMFFIGAPLGAIIRKGGLGLPIVFAVLIFITFHFINTFGKKVAQENGITPFLGTWMSTIVLAPLAVVLTYRANFDLPMSINWDFIAVPVQRWFEKKRIEDRPIPAHGVSEIAPVAAPAPQGPEMSIARFYAAAGWLFYLAMAAGIFLALRGSQPGKVLAAASGPLYLCAWEAAKRTKAKRPWTQVWLAFPLYPIFYFRNRKILIMPTSLNTIEEAIEDIRRGKVIIVVDDEDRENEGDFLAAAEKCTPEMVNFMATYGRGLICAPLTENRCKELGLSSMVQVNTDHMETAFTVSVDLRGHGVTTGISAHDRSRTVLSLIDENTRPHDLARPGHIFPLIAKQGGVLRRTGHTEAAIDFARLAGFRPAGVICEIMNEDGSMSRLPELIGVAQRHDLKIVSIEALVAYRMQHDSLIVKKEDFDLQTRYGTFRLRAYQQTTNKHVHIALTKGTWNAGDAVLTRINSTAVNNDILGTLTRDADGQLDKMFSLIGQAGSGAILFINQNLSPADLLSRITELRELQGQGIAKAPLPRMDLKDFGIGAQMLHDLDISKIRLISNTPYGKRVGMIGYGLEILEYVGY